MLRWRQHPMPSQTSSRQGATLCLREARHPVAYTPSGQAERTPQSTPAQAMVQSSPKSEGFAGLGDVLVTESSGSSAARMLALEAQLHVEIQRQQAVDQRVRTAELRAQCLVEAKADADIARGSMRSRGSRRSQVPSLPEATIPLGDDTAPREIEKDLSIAIDVCEAEGSFRQTRCPTTSRA